MPARRPLNLVLLVCLAAAMPMAGRAEMLPIRTYTTADGLAADTVYRVVADSRGFLWFCTADGLSRFDGYTFESFTTGQGLPDQRVSDVCETRGGELWVGTASGLCRFGPRGQADSSLFVVERLGEDAKANDVNCLFGTPDGALWCGTAEGLYRIEERDGAWVSSRVALGTDGAVTALAEDQWGGVWAGLAGEVRLIRPDGRVEANSLPDAGGAEIYSIHSGADGRLWVGTWLGIYHSEPRASGDAPATLSKPGPGAPEGWGNAVFESRDGTLWIATTKGLWRETGTDARSFERRTAIDSACDRVIWDVAEDRDGNLWLATSCGVLRIDRYGFTGFTKTDGLASVFVNSIFESNLGDLIVTTNQTERLIHRFDGAKFSSLAPKHLPMSYPGWGWGQTVMQDREGAWWVPTGFGAYRYPAAEQPDATLAARPETIYSGHEVFRIFEDSRGDIWLPTIANSRLLRWDRATGRVVDLTAEAGVDAEYTAFCNGPDGTVWIGTGSSGGLLRYANGHFDRLTVADGAPAGWLRALYLDSAGRMWIASSLGGLVRVDDPTSAHPHFVAYTTAEGLSSNNVWCVVEDMSGRIYAGTTRGIDRFDPSTGSVKHYTTADGLPKSQLCCAFRDRNGSLWFGSAFGLVRFDPEPEREREPPRALMTGLRVAGLARPVSALGEATLPSMELGSDENNVSLDFLGLGTSLGEELRYQHRLEGADADWSAPSAERSVTFANLAPGAYRLLVRAVDADGATSVEPAEMAFTVLAPVWRRWWFLTLAGLVVCGAVYALFRYRVARVVEIERVRMHIATDLHDDIGSNLTRIAILSEVARHDRSDEEEEPDSPLVSIARIARESVASMSDIVWAINPKKDGLDDLVRRMRRFAGEAFAARGIELEFHGPAHERSMKIDHETRRQLFLIFKESVMNAVRHSGGAKAEVDLHFDGQRLVLSVADDGHGFDPSTPTEGNGVESMRRRARALNGTLEVVPVLGRGTRVTLVARLDGGRRLRRPLRMER